MQTAAISFIKIFLSTFDMGLKKANAVGLPENVILTLLVECIIAILFAGERYYLRLLLTVVCGPTSFEDIRIIGGHFISDYRSACA